MRLSAVAVLMIITTVFLSGCGQSSTASVDDRSHNYYGRSPSLAGRMNYAPNPQTYQAVAVTSVATHDLPAPMATASSSYVPFGRASAALPSSDWQWPVNGKVTQRFGPQGNGIANEGITIEAPAGSPIRAARAGEVAFVGHDVRNYGNMVILRHANGDMTSYSHARDITVAKGAKVQVGTVVGYVGQSGGVKTPQLHFAVRERNKAIDPLSKLPANRA